jgi:hypothetical protein
MLFLEKRAQKNRVYLSKSALARSAFLDKQLVGFGRFC